ncbi:hypothetical protein [Halalkalicoccus salilacus]|uniref:hypothetical protein n=1 Tax=Halalkalicoccus salilacus TaxID=3117459 RepID=UPI00300F504F
MALERTGFGRNRQISVEEAEELLNIAAEKDAQEQSDDNEQVLKALQRLPDDTRAELARKHTHIQVTNHSSDNKRTDGGQTQSELESQSGDVDAGEISPQTSGREEATADVYLYYNWPWADTKVVIWNQNIDFEWSGDTLTRADGRAWHTKTPAGRVDQWKLTDQTSTEEGGVGDSRYRLYTTATFGMCYGIGPIDHCFNETEVWIDMTVYPGGRTEITTSLDKGVEDN